MKLEKKKSKRNSVKKKSYLLISPMGIVSILLTCLPIIYSFYVSMTEYNLTIPNSFQSIIGLKNYMEALQDKDFLNAVTTTLKIGAPALFFEIILGFGFALILNRKFKGRGLVLSLMVTPFMIAPGAAALAWRLLFDSRYGPINHILSQIAGKNIVIDWLGAPDIAFKSLTIIDIWQTTPFVMLIILAGLSSISSDVYEAAKVDGASRFQIFRDITLPLVRPILGVAVLFRTIDIIKMFDMCHALTKGGPAGTTTTLSYYIYKQGLAYSRVGYGAALSFITLLIVSVLVMIYISRTMKGGSE